MDNNEKVFKPTSEWMSLKYDEMNDKLFNGELGECDFSIFTSGTGSEGGVLGWFKIGNRSVKANRYDRQMYVQHGAWGDKTYINRGNFYDLCHPRIELNGNYTGTEKAFLATLVHEMCHYYNYMYGYIPKQGHGREFKEIAHLVSSRSGGEFTIQRLASAEVMNELELSAEMKAKREKRLANKKSKIYAVFEFRKNGEVHLTTTSMKGLIDSIVSRKNDSYINKVVLSNDKNLIDLLFSYGYKRNMRSWRYWQVGDKDWIKTLDDYDIETYENDDYEEPKRDNEVTLGINGHKQPRRIFSIKTSNGTFECDSSSYSSLFKSIKEKFPKMSDDAINKIINNPNNYRLEENKMKTRKIIREVIEEFIQNEFRGGKNDDVIEITPEMNLGLHSPLEIE